MSTLKLLMSSDSISVNRMQTFNEIHHIGLTTILYLLVVHLYLFIYLFIYSFTHSLTHSFIHSLLILNRRTMRPLTLSVKAQKAKNTREMQSIKHERMESTYDTM